MDSANRTRNNKYDRVMSRVHNQSCTSLKSSSFVTRHDIPLSERVGAKSVASNVSSSGVFNELPTFLNDYVPESTRDKVKRTYVVKPRKTIRSLDLAASPPRTKQREVVKKPSNIRVRESAPSVLISNEEKWSATHFRECLSSRSHSRLKDLKDEIKAYKETEKLMRLRSSLFKKCGVVLDDVGNMAEDKAVQAELADEVADDAGQMTIRFRYPNEYAAPPESVLLPEDLPDDMYENLIDERPDLEPILAPLRKTEVRRPNYPKMLHTSKTNTVPVSKPSVYHEFEYPGVYREEEADDEQQHGMTSRGTVRYSSQRAKRLEYNTTLSRAAARSSRSLPIWSERNQTYYNDSRRQFEYPPGFDEGLWQTAPIKATCYTCGYTGYSNIIPRNPLCHDMFDSQDWRARTLSRYFRSVCLYSWKWRHMKIGATYPYFWHEDKFKSRGLILRRLGDYIPGCFKRYLDIGTVYTARGCRKMWPDTSRGGMSANRFLRLEWLLRRYNDRCISSPHASLTPFARGISLFARYHVCVCSGKFCNRATVSEPQNMFLLLASFIISVFDTMNNLQ